ncbi:MAG: cytidylate kinase-like family protein [Elusimicrobia bacterium]|nr:cytidylate kinase-like family protein [Elusimicrobiota bacterium]
MHESHPLDELVKEQVQRWQARRSAPVRERARQPAIAISRMPGCGGGALALALARRLGFDLFGKELLHKVAQSAHLSEAMLRSVDEKAQSAISEWIESLFTGRFIGGEYAHHLSRTLMAIAVHGRAIILGRGAALILPPDSCLRVLLIAPREDRIRAIMSRDGLGRKEAERLVVRVESERRAFIRQHFHEEVLDPLLYDLTLNTAGLDREAQLSTIRTAWEKKGGQAAAGPAGD